MSNAEPIPVRNRRNWPARFAIVIAILLAVLLIAGSYLLQPQRASRLLLDRIGNALGLRITASGQASYRLRGVPQLVLHNVVAQRPGDTNALLRAERVFVSIPWSTIRARGGELSAQRVELDAPVLDVPALQRWLATRPPSETQIPTLTDGLHITRGRLNNGSWSIDGIGLDLPSLAPNKPLRTHLLGRYLEPPTSLAFDLDVALTKPANDAGLAAIGSATLRGVGWKLPSQVFLSGPIHLGEGEVSMSPVKLGLFARYMSDKSTLPFVLGAAGPLRLAKGVWSMEPAALVLRGSGVIPDANAKGALALGRRMALRLHGTIAAWPKAWPALPPPLSASTSPMQFILDYVGPIDFSEMTSLALRRDDTTFDARFMLPVVVGWVDSGTTGSPLPPLQGHLHTPTLEIAGATLEGVEVTFEDNLAVPAPAKP